MQTGVRTGEQPQYELLVGSDEFWRRARSDILSAQRRVLLQAMTFEGDATGLAVAAALKQSGAKDRRVLVDDFTRMVVSDSFVRSPRFLLDSAFRAEVRSTSQMFRALSASGVCVRTTNPTRGNVLRYAGRNHKKLIVADDVAYIGGVNFSDHNFAWHDLMLRISGTEVGAFLADDFHATWQGTAILRRSNFGDLDLTCLDGRTNKAGFAALFSAIAHAKRRIVVISPYLSFPFIAHLQVATERGVQVEVLTPLANNKPLVRNYLLGATEGAGLSVRLTPKMSHLKAMLIDDELMVLGSSNFDFPSYHSMEEYLALIESPALIDTFKRDVLAPMNAESFSAAEFRPGLAAVLTSRFALGLGGLATKHLGRFERGATADQW